MPASFEPEMEINADGCLTPGGPLGLAAGETPLRLDFWIFQDGGACMAFLPSPQGDFLPEGKWKMKSDLHDIHFGERFKAGAAIGMGLLVKRVGEGPEALTIVEQWNRPINLVAPSVKGSPDH